MHGIATLALFTLTVFLLSGGVGFTIFWSHGQIVGEPYPMQYVYAPIVFFLLSLGVMGVYMLHLAPYNFTDKRKLADRQCFVGLTLLTVCAGGMELLLALSLS